MKDHTIILKLRVKGEYADPTKWDWNELLNIGDDFQVLSVELAIGNPAPAIPEALDLLELALRCLDDEEFPQLRDDIREILKKLRRSP